MKEILDRMPLPPTEQIPAFELVESSEDHESLSRWQIPRTQIVISRMLDGPRRGEYLFSAGTVARAPELYARAEKQPYKTDSKHPLSEGLYHWWLATPGRPVNRDAGGASAIFVPATSSWDVTLASHWFDCGDYSCFWHHFIAGCPRTSARHPRFTMLGFPASSKGTNVHRLKRVFNVVSGLPRLLYSGGVTAHSRMPSHSTAAHDAILSFFFLTRGGM